MRLQSAATAAAAAFLAAACTPAMAAGPTYDAGQIHTFAVAGVRLGMTSEEAARTLQSAGYQGVLSPFTATERSSNDLWSMAGRDAQALRYLAPDGQVRVWSMVMEQRFDQPHKVDDLRAAVVSRYGEPTEEAVDGEEVILTYRDAQVETGDKTKPRLFVDFTPVYLHAEVTDPGARDGSVAAAAAATDAVRKAAAARNAEVGF